MDATVTVAPYYVKIIMRQLIMYTAFIFLGHFSFMRCACSHCLYPYKNSDCIYLPYRMVHTTYTFRSYPMNKIESLITAFVLAALVIIPQYWLFNSYILMIIFWLFCGFTLIANLFYLCKRCKNTNCPMCRTLHKPAQIPRKE